MFLRTKIKNILMIGWGILLSIYSTTFLSLLIPILGFALLGLWALLGLFER